MTLKLRIFRMIHLPFANQVWFQIKPQIIGFRTRIRLLGTLIVAYFLIKNLRSDPGIDIIFSKNEIFSKKKFRF